WAFSGHEDPTPGDMAIMTVLIAGPILALLPLAALVQRRRLAPILATAPLTAERISNTELRQNMERATSLRQLLNACISSVFACFAAIAAVGVHMASKHTAFDGFVAVWGIIATVFAAVSVVWYRRVLRKADAV